MKLKSIQVLRGLAALLVVAYHVRAFEKTLISENGSSETAWISGLLTNGYAGVDLFFVISGFIMVYITYDLNRDLRSAADFIFARATRIFPVWWFFALLALIALTLSNTVLPGGKGIAAVAHGQPFIPYLLKSLALIPQSAFPILNVGWTLIHEMYFYIVFALILFAPRAWWPALLLIWGGAIVAGSLMGLSGPFTVDMLSLVFHPMTMEFILGAAVGLMAASGLRWRSGIITLIAVLWVMFVLCYQGLETPATLQWGRVTWYGLPFALLIFGFATLDLDRRLNWLIPAGAGALVCFILYQMYGLTDVSPDAARLGATIVSVIVGAIAMAVVIWFGWLGGQSMPQRMIGLAPRFEGALNRLVRLGDWSFSLYLVHILVIGGLKFAFSMVGKIGFLAPLFQVGHPGPIDNILFAVMALTSSVIAAAFAYRYIERPCIIFFGKLRERIFYSTPESA